MRQQAVMSRVLLTHMASTQLDAVRQPQRVSDGMLGMMHLTTNHQDGHIGVMQCYAVAVELCRCMQHCIAIAVFCLCMQYCIAIQWPTSWIATKGYTKFEIGFENREDAQAWHAKVQEQLQHLRMRSESTRSDTVAYHSQKSSSEDVAHTCAIDAPPQNSNKLVSLTSIDNMQLQEGAKHSVAQQMLYMLMVVLVWNSGWYGRGCIYQAMMACLCLFTIVTHVANVVFAL